MELKKKKATELGADAGFALSELIWEGRFQLGDEPGVFSDGSFPGLCLDLPFNVEISEPTGSTKVGFALEAKNVHVFGTFPGHRVRLFLYRPVDPGNVNGPWKRTVLAEGFMKKDLFVLPADLAGLTENPIFVSLRVEVDTSVRAGLYNNFVLRRLSKFANDFKYSTSFGFMVPLS